jgi:hypothetical protein
MVDLVSTGPPAHKEVVVKKQVRVVMKLGKGVAEGHSVGATFSPLGPRIVPFDSYFS